MVVSLRVLLIIVCMSFCRVYALRKIPAHLTPTRVLFASLSTSKQRGDIENDPMYKIPNKKENKKSSIGMKCFIETH